MEKRKAIKKEVKEPSIATLNKWLSDGRCRATDGCWVEPDGKCPHGCNSWLIEIGLIN